MDRLTRARIAGQSGLLTRGQALAAGMTDRAIEWQLACGHWARIHPGVYQTQPGRADWEMRAVAGLLYAGRGAVLAGRSAGHAWGFIKQEPDTLEILVPADRRVRDQPQLTIRRGRHTEARTDSIAWPHRTTAEHTVLDLAATKPVDGTTALLAKALSLGRVTEGSMRLALDERSRQPNRLLLLEMLTDVGLGAESPSEVRYLRDVERAHGLPRCRRQAPFAGGRRDVDYDEWLVVVEIDGRLAHAGWRNQQRDGRRDRKAAVGGRLTVRCYWPDVLRPGACELADDLGAILRTRGWSGQLLACGLACTAVTVAERKAG